MWYKDKKWWDVALDRVFRSMAQGVLFGIGENVVVWDFNWKIILGAAIGMGIASLATSITLGIPDYDGDSNKE